MGTSAWDFAREAAESAGVELRPADRLQDAAAIVEIMRATWGNGDLLPPEMVVALAEAGNVPHAAFDGDEMIGYVLGWAGIDAQDGLHMHSHMLAALPDRRHKGVGYALKLAQRAHCLDQGIHLVRWTFDPMVARNAWFNLGKLGAVADRFRRNFYGQMSDELNAGERSDRLVVRWELDREPIPRRASDDAERLEVPREYADLRAADPAAAAAERDRVADVLEARIGKGWTVAGFEPERSAYVLTPEGVGS